MNRSEEVPHALVAPLVLAGEPCEGDRLDLDPVVYWKRRAATLRRDNDFLRGVIRCAVADLDTDRPKDVVAAELAGSLEPW